MGIKKVKPNKGKILKEKEQVTVEAFQHPVFCFKYIHTDYALGQCTTEEKVALIEQMIRLGSMNWQDIRLSHRHGMGSEKINRSSIKTGIPAILTDDINHLLAFRFSGKAPFVGWRNKFIFHVFYIDRAFTLYNH